MRKKLGRPAIRLFNGRGLIGHEGDLRTSGYEDRDGERPCRRALKEEIKGAEAEGTRSSTSGRDREAADLPDHVYPAALAVGEGRAERGIFVDGVGYGSAMIANKIDGRVTPRCARTRSAPGWPARIRTPTCSASAARSSVRRSRSRS